MLKAYIDASWSDDLIVVGGVIHPKELWPTFEKAWREMLQKYEIRYRFHATEYWARKGEFMRMRESDHVALGNDVRAMFTQFKPMNFVCVLSKDAYQQWRLKQTEHPHKDGTFYALDWCLTFLIHQINQHPVDDGVEIIFDQGDGRERLSADIAEWKIEKLRQNAWRFPGHPDPNRAVKLKFASSKDVLPLQIADVVVHTSLRSAQAHLTGEDARAVPFFREMERMMRVEALFTLDDIEFFRRIHLDAEKQHRENMAMAPVPMPVVHQRDRSAP